MEPRVQYVKTPDGVNIAYYEMGEGTPFVYLTMPFSHLTAEWRVYGPLLTGIAANYRLVRFDPRGFGLSDRNLPEMSLDAFTTDLETVVDRLDLPPFILNAGVIGMPIGVSYAARHPDRLTHLILVEACARAPEVVVRQANSAVSMGDDWRFISETLLRFIQGWDRPEESAGAAQLLRDSLDLADARRMIDWFARLDIADLLPSVTTRTLVVNSTNNPWAGVEYAREVVAGLPNAELALVRGAGDMAYIAETVLAVRAFLGVTDPRPLPFERARPPADVGLTVILFADIAGSTALTERVGDASFRERARRLDEALRASISRDGGTVIDAKTLGDGVLATFPAASQAIAAALACAESGDRHGLPLHLGLHAGDVIREEGNVFGGAVNIAARISAESSPGEVLVSDVVRSLARTSSAVAFDDRGERELKGVTESVRVFSVRSGE